MNVPILERTIYISVLIDINMACTINQEYLNHIPKRINVNKNFAIVKLCDSAGAFFGSGSHFNFVKLVTNLIAVVIQLRHLLVVAFPAKKVQL